jgi:hypothetical protein
MNRRYRNRQFISLISIVVLVVTWTIWALMSPRITKETGIAMELPPGPHTTADLPAMRNKSKALKADAAEILKGLSHSRDRRERAMADQVWNDVFYTDEIYPAAARVRDLEIAGVIQRRPGLSADAQLVREYQEERHRIATEVAAADRPGALAQLEARLGPALHTPEHQRSAQAFEEARVELIGDPEHDAAQAAYLASLKAATLKRHPEMAAYFDERDTCEKGYADIMARANSLDREIERIENPAPPVQPPPLVVTAAATPPPITTISSSAPATPLPPQPATNEPPATPVLARFDEAASYGIKVGDTVSVAALKPMVAFHRALIMSMNTDTLTVKNDGDSFTIRWHDLTHLRAAN